MISVRLFLSIVLLGAACCFWNSRGLAAEDPAVSEKPSAAASPVKFNVGLRRSSYGLRGKNGDDAWWAERAKENAAAFPGAQPVLIEIVSGHRDDGSTEAT